MMVHPEGDGAAAVFARARRAAESLRATPARERVAFYGALRSVILRRQEEILDAVQRETGKCRSDGLMSEIFPVLDSLEYLERQGPRVLADRKVHTPLFLMGKTSKVIFEPLGVVLVICPWNYPFYQALVPSLSALACGNAVVYKPSEVTPLRGLVESLLAEAGMPAGWVQVVYGDGAVAETLIDQRPDKIFFIGSGPTGRKILKRAAEHLIPVELELGGKDPMIVFEDANLDRAAAGAAWGALTNTGQSCTSVERVYVQESVYEGFRQRLLKEVGRVVQKVDGNGDSDMGVMTSDAQVRIVARHVDEAVAAGAQLLTGSGWDRQSKAIPPLVLEQVSPEMAVCRDETFGPVIPLIPFATEADAVRLANDSEYGLSASVWSADMKRCDRVARALVTGNVSVNNVMLTEGNPALPFGGAKSSGFGRYKGEFGFYSFSNIKSVLVDKNSAKIEANWYPLTAAKYTVFARMTAALFRGGIMGLVGFALAGMKLEGLAARLWKNGRPRH
jgi:aldehyde dehydrogenase (NAD+)